MTGFPPEIHEEVNEPDIKFLFDKTMEVSKFHYSSGHLRYQIQWWIYIAKFWTRASPSPPSFLHFHTVFSKIG